MRLSLRELLGLTAACAVGLMALLRTHEAWWLVLSGAAMLAALAAAVVAWGPPTPGREWARGALICGLGYLLLLKLAPTELTPQGSLPTTRLLTLLHQRVHSATPTVQLPESFPETQYVVWQTPWPSYVPSTGQSIWPSSPGYPTQTFFLNQPGSPARFLRTGHLLIAIVLAWLGGRLAVSRAMPAQASPSAAGSATSGEPES